MMKMGGKRKLEGGGGGGGAHPPAPKSRRAGGEVDRSKKVKKDLKNAAGGSNSGDGDEGPSRTSSRVVAAQLHPLLNELVLRNLFKFLPLEHLAPSRLVCRTWMDAALPAWRSSATPRIIYSATATGRANYVLNGSFGTSLAEFMEFWEEDCQRQASVAKPFRQFQLENWRLSDLDADAGGADPNGFVRVVGAHVSKLKLENCKSSSSGKFFRLINNCLPNLESLSISNSVLCEEQMVPRRLWDLEWEAQPAYQVPVHGEHPNLKSLEVIYPGPGRNLSIHRQLGISYVELLSHFPSLAAVKLDVLFQRTEVLEILKAVQMIRMEDPRKVPISRLSTGDHVDFDFGRDPIWLRRATNHFPSQVWKTLELLEELQITLDSVELNDDFLHLPRIQKALEINGPTLKVLSVRMQNARIAGMSGCEFPFGVPLPNLERLSMAEGFCKNFEFIRSTPNLEELAVVPYLGRKQDGKSWPATVFSTASKSVLANTQLLRLSRFEMDSFTVTDRDLRWLVKWLPRVKNLTMILNDKLFGIVCENWQDLVELRVVGRELTDEGVTGMRPQVHTQKATRSGRGKKTVEWEVANPPIPCVTDLAGLEVFIAEDAKLTHVSLTHGLLKLERLRETYFRNYANVLKTAKGGI